MKAEKHQVRKIVQDCWKLQPAENALTYTTYEYNYNYNNGCHYSPIKRVGRYYSITRDKLHTTTAQYYRNIKRETERLQNCMKLLQSDVEEAQQLLQQTKSEINTEKLQAAKTALVSKIGFTAEQTEHLLTGKSLRFSGSLYSDEHRKNFKVEDAEIKVFSTSAKPNLLILAVNRQPITEWFKEQWDNLKSRIYTKGRKFGI